MKNVRLAALQLNPTVGDLRRNWDMTREAYLKAAAGGANIAVTSECVIQGYPFEDLAYNRAFNADSTVVVSEVEAFMLEQPENYPLLVLGTSVSVDDKLFNSAIVFAPGKGMIHYVNKCELPNYGVFDEKRIFTALKPTTNAPFTWNGINIGVMICEDMWWPNVAKQFVGVDIVLVLNGSPFEVGKNLVRLENTADRIMQTGAPLFYVNQVGGQDELVFDGGSFLMGKKGIVQFPFFEEGVFFVDHEIADRDLNNYRDGIKSVAPTGDAEIYMAGVLALRDYVRKQRRADGSQLFTDVVLGLSGGIDSGVVAAQAVDALGAAHVHTVRLPGECSSDHSLKDAYDEAEMLGVELLTIPINEVVSTYDKALSPYTNGLPADTSEENIQARTRGVILMYLSNKRNWMVLSTGNKSEVSVGYATLYGDMCGGYNTLKDVYKMKVYAIAKWRNTGNIPSWFLGPKAQVIPQNTIDKEPSAELRFEQKDSDSLPPYPVLDAILEGLVDKDMSFTEIQNNGYDIATIRRVARMLYSAEYKRRQACPGVKITHKIFGRDRRWPIVNNYFERS